jgi:hypothetical protein
MVDARLIQYLKNYVSQGYSRDQLELHLVSQGWNRKDLDDAFDQVMPRAAPEKKPFFQFKQPAAAPKEEKHGFFFKKKPKAEARPDLEARARGYAEAGLYHEEKPSSHFVPVAVLACVFLIIGVFFYSYFYVINPTFVSKPVLTRPEIPTVGSAVNTAQVEYMLNELDLYKLHGNPVG